MTRSTILLTLIAASALATPVAAGKPSTETAEIRAAVRKSLPYIEERGVWWIKNKKCTSCHRVTFMVWSLIEAGPARLLRRSQEARRLDRLVAAESR